MQPDLTNGFGLIEFEATHVGIFRYDLIGYDLLLLDSTRSNLVWPDLKRFQRIIHPASISVELTSI